MTPSETIVPTCRYCGDSCPVGYGKCHCGCDNDAPLSDCSRGKGRPKKGQPNKFIQHHGPGVASKVSFGEIGGYPVAFIEVSGGYQAIVDRGREREVPGHWHPHSGYACQSKRVNGERTLIYMHKIIMGVGKEACGDHKFGNRMDNRISQLRPANRHQNGMNHGPNKRTKSGVVGVRWVEARKKWVATITYKGKLIYVGYSTVFEEAVQFRRAAEEKYFGEYARSQVNPKTIE